MVTIRTNGATFQGESLAEVTKLVRRTTKQVSALQKALDTLRATLGTIDALGLGATPSEPKQAVCAQVSALSYTQRVSAKYHPKVREYLERTGETRLRRNASERGKPIDEVAAARLAELDKAATKCVVPN